MNTLHRTLARQIRRAPMAACLAAALALPASTSSALTMPVLNCNDDGIGSLRKVIQVAESGDTIDLSALACSTITLTTGAIHITALQSDLILRGPGADQLAIDGGLNSRHYNRVLNHLGTGTLTIQGLTIANARYEVATTALGGGCIFSTGNVSLHSSTVSGCAVVAENVFGGGIYAQGNVTLVNSTVTGNVARSTIIGNGKGGGIFALGAITLLYSSITNNQSTNAQVPPTSRGGGIFAVQQLGNLGITNSTISGNQAGSGAGLYINDSPTHTASISNSTISGNAATVRAGGVYSRGVLALSNSTIAFNSGPGDGAGMVASGSVQMQSSMIATNRSSTWVASDLAGPAAFTGSDNLIVAATTTVPVPAGTLTECPKLGPLADNGALTQTHALLHNAGAVSPAIDHGNNSASFSVDQRGFARVAVMTTDIGAYEWQGETSDRVFVDSLESVCN